MKAKISLFIIALAIALGCDEKNVTLDSGLYNVSFVGNSSSRGEANEEAVSFPIKLMAPAQSQDVTVEILVSGTAVEGEDFELLTPTVTIPAGEFFADVEVDLFDDFDEDGSKTIILEIGSVSGGLKSGLTDGSVGKKNTITIADNDCALDLSEFVGAYDVELDNAAAFVYGAGVLCCLETNLQLGAEPGTLVDTDFYGLVSGGFANANAAVRLVVDGSNPANITVALNPSPVLGYTNAAGAPRNYRQQATLGTLFTCDKKFTVKFEIVDGAGAVRQVTTLTYTKK